MPSRVTRCLPLALTALTVAGVAGCSSGSRPPLAQPSPPPALASASAPAPSVDTPGQAPAVDPAGSAPVAVPPVAVPPVAPAGAEPQAIRRVDFRNFSYTDFKTDNEPYRLSAGSFGSGAHTLLLTQVTYGDLTGDGVEEAAVLVRETFGAQSPTLHLVYVYVFGLDPAGRPVVVGTRTVSAVTPTVTIDGGRLVETVSLPASSDGAANPARVTRLALTAGRLTPVA